MDPANCELVILPGAVGFEVVFGVLRVLGVATALRLIELANCEVVILPGAVGFAVVLDVLRVLGIAMALLFDECCGVVLRLIDPANCELVILPGAVGFAVTLGVLGVATALRLMDPTNGVLGVLRVLGVEKALLSDDCCGVEKSCRVVALEVARA